jgi:hypothetical protein
MSRYDGDRYQAPPRFSQLPVPAPIGSACPSHGPTHPIAYPGGVVYVCAECGWRDGLSRELIEARRQRLAYTVELTRQITDADRPNPFRRPA